MPSDVTYEQVAGKLPPSTQQSIITLYEEVFATGSERIIKRLRRSDLVVILAKSERQVVGFKAGYPETPNRFYSWLGCVHPVWQRKGIAQEMMWRQHTYCRANGFTTVRTKTTNQWRNMLLLNIQHDFRIIGTYLDDRDEVKIMLEKQLTN